MKKLPLILVLFSSALLLGGCASIVDGGRTRVVNINSKPDGALVSITNNRTGETVFRGQTPTSIALKRADGFFKGASYTVTYTLNGYATQTAQISSTVNGWYYGNLAFGYLIGLLIVDPETGAMYTLPPQAAVTLVPQPQKTADGKSGKAESSLVVMNLNDVPQSLRSSLVAIR